MAKGRKKQNMKFGIIKEVEILYLKLGLNTVAFIAITLTCM